MRLTIHITEVKHLVSRGAGTLTAGKAIRGLAIGVLLIAGTGMYFGITADNEDGNLASSERTTNFPVDWEADLEAYRSSLPNYVDEEGSAASSERTTNFPVAFVESYQTYLPGLDRLDDQMGEAVREWQRSYLPGIDRLDDQIAAELESGNPPSQGFPSDIDE